MVTGQAPVTLELRNTPGKKHKQTKGGYTHISQLTQFMPSPETYKSEIGSQPTMRQVHTGAYVSLLAPGKTDYTACHPRNTTGYHVYIARSTYHHAYARQTQVNWKKETKKRKEDTRKERKEKTRKQKNEKGKKRKDKKSKKKRKNNTRRGSKGRKREKHVILL